MKNLSKQHSAKRNTEAEKKVSSYRELSAGRSKTDRSQKQFFSKVEWLNFQRRQQFQDIYFQCTSRAEKLPRDTQKKETQLVVKEKSVFKQGAK